MGISVGMHKLIALASVSLLAVACGAASAPAGKSADDAASSKKSAAAKDKKSSNSELATNVDFDEPERAAPLASREVGDFFVHRFSGSFSDKPMTLSEAVVAKKGNLIVIDYTLDEGGKQARLRVTHDMGTDRVLRVREMQGDKEIPSDAQAYEAMMEKTLFIPDENEKKLGQEKTTCLVGGKELDCEKTSYEVRVGDKTATFTVTHSNQIEDRDVAGEISTSDGKIIYKAELVDMGHGTPSGVASRE